MRWEGHVARMGDMRNAYNVLVGKYEGKRLLGRPRCRWKDTIRIDLREIVWKVGEWMHLAEDRDQLRAFVKTVMNIRVL
jgi:hypothetical protein